MLDPSELVDIHYETFAASPCRLSGRALPLHRRRTGPGPYLAACAGLVWSSTNRTRDTVEWSPEERAGVERLIDRFELLSPYSFDD